MSFLKYFIFVFTVNFMLKDISSISGHSFWKIKELVENRREKSAIHDYRRLYGSGQFIEEVLLTQPLDHFDAYSSRTYKQKIYINAKNWNKPNGPIFLYIGGEVALSNRSAYSGHHVQMAKLFGAMVVAAEHRFYGDSINDDGLHLDQLQHLSSQQGLADLTKVHNYITTRYELNDNKWICFGGSYPGALSAWFRLKFPHLVFGAVASSAPVQAQTDFQGYNEVVAQSLADPAVGGSKQCTAQVAEAFQKIDRMVSGQQTKGLAKDFLSCGSLSEPNDQKVFVNILAAIFMGIVQFNNEFPFLNIKNLCNIMRESGDSYSNLQKINQMMMKLTNQSCVDNRYSSYLSYLRNQTVDRRALKLSIRQWIWQTCTQFGYYMTCKDGTSCPFSRLMTLESHLALCKEVYKISENMVPKFVQFTNDYYGANHPKGTRIIFVNGSIDPWHFLSVLKSDQVSGEVAVFINGTAHCADMATQKSTDPQSLKEARLVIQKEIASWLKET
ncbi:thymus-specific serine protease-like [Saccostrea echinata]|uniref:thymus-specific serine protease-like n=1 Tax=Saccostrea echinata TaxID=191078 RepID=UPI002A7ED8D8|nr:thymus-specific serine protease-like [Saccostrea echinata]